MTINNVNDTVLDPPVTYSPTGNTLSSSQTTNLSGNNDTLSTALYANITDYVVSTGILTDLSNNSFTTITGVENFLMNDRDQLTLDAPGDYSVTLTGSSGAVSIKLVEGNPINLALYRDLTTPVINMEFNDTSPNTTNTSYLDLANHTYQFNAVTVDWPVLTSAIVGIGIQQISMFIPYVYQVFDHTGMPGITTKVESFANIDNSFFTQYGATTLPPEIHIVLGADLSHQNQAIVPDSVDFSAISANLTFNSNYVGLGTLDTTLSTIRSDDNLINVYKLIHYEHITLGSGNDTIIINDPSTITINTIDGFTGFDTVQYSAFGIIGQTSPSMTYDGENNLLQTYTSTASATLTILNIEKILGGFGVDTFISGTQNEVFKGNFDTDHFIFHQNNGQDIIEDFNRSVGEKIDLQDYNFSSINDFTSISADPLNAANLILNLDGTNTITLLNISSVTDTDFIF